jgi:APA family basic amino acid/polyamine antiporter
LRKTHPETPRPFRAPLGALTPILGAGVSLLQMAALPLVTWMRLLIWLAIGLAIYFGYGARKSRMGATSAARAA